MRVIQQVEVFPLHLPVIRDFRFASGSAGKAGGVAPHVLVRVADSEGETGWGEGRPLPSWSYETLETVVATIRRYLGPALIGLPVTDRYAMHQRMNRAIGRGPSPGQPIAKAAVDMAVHDLAARGAGLSLRSFLGGSDERSVVELSYTLGARTAAGTAEEVHRAREQGFRHFNFKAAVAPETDIEVARALVESAGEEAFVWADANQGFQLHQARQVAREFAALGVDLLEQPLPADQMHLMRQLRRAGGVALGIDESSVGPADFFHYAAEGLVDYLVLKLGRSGGIWPTLQQIAVAQAAGLPLVVSGLSEGLLAKTAACQVALAFGCSGPAALNGSQFIDESALYPDKAGIEYGGAVHLSGAPGIGVQPKAEGLERFLVGEAG